jgi:peptidoglycan/xylan/chitin deacetylase (PgdA/CDA1 family)
MIVSHTPSLLWHKIPEDIWERVQELLERTDRATVFFRADDVAIPSMKQDRLLSIFTSCSAPLCAAMIPAWINAERWDSISRTVHGRHALFAWHQHGWNHLNHETVGKKQEFGPGTSTQEKRRAIVRGRDKLRAILGEHFLQVFTPPWNRVDPETMHILREEGFRAISRYCGDKLPSLPDLPDLPVNVDLHTRKEPSPAEGWSALLVELEQALTSGTAGFMIHHQRMNKAAFLFLEQLLPRLQAHAGIKLVHFGSLLKTTT